MSGGHALTRTSPKGKGQEFIGTCIKCAMEGLPVEATGKPCVNPANITNAEALGVMIGRTN